jgi:1,6-anhydro-N-acetylmuramate kinase
MKRWFSEDFDKDGRKAAEGKLSEQLLERLMEDQYIRNPPPKSTGREVASVARYMTCKLIHSSIACLQHYNEKYISSIVTLCEELNIPKEDCIATLTGSLLHSPAWPTPLTLLP